MAINAAWPLYIHKSIAIYLHGRATTDSLPLIVETMDKRGATWEAAATRLECTITGPWSDERAKGCYDISVNISVVATTKRASNYTDSVDAAGKVANWLDTCIECKDYGDGGTNTIGFLQIDPDERIKVTPLRPKQDDDQLHTIIEARYMGLFDES
jgi:hypothetical protein